MSPEDIIMQEMSKWGEYIDEIDQLQTSAFLVGILAHRIYANELKIEYLEKRLNFFENGQKIKEIPKENG